MAKLLGELLTGVGVLELLIEKLGGKLLDSLL